MPGMRKKRNTRTRGVLKSFNKKARNVKNTEKRMIKPPAPKPGDKDINL